MRRKFKTHTDVYDRSFVGDYHPIFVPHSKGFGHRAYVFGPFMLYTTWKMGRREDLRVGMNPSSLSLGVSMSALSGALFSSMMYHRPFMFWYLGPWLRAYLCYRVTLFPSLVLAATLCAWKDASCHKDDRNLRWFYSIMYPCISIFNMIQVWMTLPGFGLNRSLLPLRFGFFLVPFYLCTLASLTGIDDFKHIFPGFDEYKNDPMKMILLPNEYDRLKESGADLSTAIVNPYSSNAQSSNSNYNSDTPAFLRFVFNFNRRFVDRCGDVLFTKALPPVGESEWCDSVRAQLAYFRQEGMDGCSNDRLTQHYIAFVRAHQLRKHANVVR